jgi:hypothetical protein
MVDEPPIALAPVGDTSPDAVAEIGSILASVVNAQIVIASRIPLIASAYDAKRKQPTGASASLSSHSPDCDQAARAYTRMHCLSSAQQPTDSRTWPHLRSRPLPSGLRDVVLEHAGRKRPKGPGVLCGTCGGAVGSAVVLYVDISGCTLRCLRALLSDDMINGSRSMAQGSACRR